MASKPFREMSDAELLEQHRYWDAKVRDYPCWGAGLVVAAGFRDACAAILAERGRATAEAPADPGPGAEHRC